MTALRCLDCGALVRPADAADDLGVLNALDDVGRHRCPPTARRPAGRHSAASATSPPRAVRMQPPLGEAPTSPCLFAVIDHSGSTVGRALLLLPALRLARATGGKVVGP